MALRSAVQRFEIIDIFGASGYFPEGGDDALLIFKRMNGVTHMRSKIKQESKWSGVLKTIANPNPGSVWPKTDAANREQQKHGFGQNQDLVVSSP